MRRHTNTKVALSLVVALSPGPLVCSLYAPYSYQEAEHYLGSVVVDVFSCIYPQMQAVNASGMMTSNKCVSIIGYLGSHRRAEQQTFADRRPISASYFNEAQRSTEVVPAAGRTTSTTPPSSESVKCPINTFSITYAPYAGRWRSVNFTVKTTASGGCAHYPSSSLLRG